MRGTFGYVYIIWPAYSHRSHGLLFSPSFAFYMATISMQPSYPDRRTEMWGQQWNGAVGHKNIQTSGNNVFLVL